MKRKLTVTIEFDDDPFYVEAEDTWYEVDAVGYAMDAATRIAYDFCGEFEKAELDGNLLFTRTGEAPENVRKHPKFDWIMDSLR